MDDVWLWLDARLQGTYYTPASLMQSTLALIIGFGIVKLAQVSTHSGMDEKAHQIRAELIRQVAARVDQENRDAREQEQGNGGEPGEPGERASREAEVKRLEREVEGLDAENQDLVRECSDIQKQSGLLTDDYNKAAQELVSLTTKNGTETTRKENLEKSIKELESSIKEADKSTKAERHKIVQSKADQKRMNREIGDLKVQIEAEKKRIGVLDKQVADENTKVTDMESLIETKDGLVETKMGEIKKHENNFDRLKSAYNRLDDSLDRECKLNQLISCRNIEEELGDAKTRLLKLESQRTRDTANSTLAEQKIEKLGQRFDQAETKKQALESELQRYKTKNKVAKDFYTERDLKTQIALGETRGSASEIKQTLADLSRQEEDIRASLEDFTERNKVLKARLDQVEREKRAEIDKYEKLAHQNWMGQKDADTQIEARIREEADLMVTKSQLSEQMLQVRNISCIGAPGGEYSDSDEDIPGLKRPTPPPGMDMMGMPFGINPMMGYPMQPLGHMYPSAMQPPRPGSHQMPMMPGHPMMAPSPGHSPYVTQVSQQPPPAATAPPSQQHSFQQVPPPTSSSNQQQFAASTAPQGYPFFQQQSRGRAEGQSSHGHA